MLLSELCFCKNFCQQNFTLYPYLICCDGSFYSSVQMVSHLWISTSKVVFSPLILLGRKWHLYSKSSAGKNYPDEERGGICQEHQWDAAEPLVPVPRLPLGHPRCSHGLHHLQHPQGGPGRSETLYFSFLNTQSTHPGRYWPRWTGLKKKCIFFVFIPQIRIWKIHTGFAWCWNYQSLC